MRLGTLTAAAALVAATMLMPAAGPTTAPAYAAPAGDHPGNQHGDQHGEHHGAVVEKRVIGHSVRGRPIRAWRLGEPGKRRVLLISTMHGDEGRTRQILESLRDGRPIRGVDLWVVPVYNPDGLARGTRKNAHGVDLNRNFPYAWADLDGSYESGPRPASEPETRAMMRFLKKIEPSRILSFHQPLHGVDTATKSPAFSRKVASHLRLPRRSLTCGGVCHGTMTGWFNHRSDGAALTVEYGSHPPRKRMAEAAPRQVLHLFDAHRVKRPRR
ncbi:M14 family zinc carboxypeptidase [Nocardioides soli]|uniref:Putative deacylase n=1 Tax=Nocardioides soli TaxID=1036020 RepID=A0A7W4YZU4_9ACTN|nr:M14 family zinc carboxypeptidase [Nocardioides soli]MBB3041297.1 putative deacylase [Nocardioides soli]